MVSGDTFTEPIIMDGVYTWVFVDGLTRGGVMVSQFSRGVRHLAQFEDGTHGSLSSVMRTDQTEEWAFRVHCTWRPWRSTRSTNRHRPNSYCRRSP